jgi:hypothetical protein
MRGSVTSRALSAALVGVVVLLAAGGGYAVASSSSKEITACVHKHGRGLYTGKCAKHDKRLTWNTTGPAGPAGPPGAGGAAGAPGATGSQGPGATSLVFNGAGASTPSAATLGTADPYTLSGECIEPSAGTTTTRLLEVGPAATIDGFEMIGTAAHALSLAFPAHSAAAQLVSVASTSTTPATSYFHLLLLPTSGTAVDLQITISAVGGATNTCHASVVVIRAS